MENRGNTASANTFAALQMKISNQTLCFNHWLPHVVSEFGQDTWPVVSVSLQSGEAVLQGWDRGPTTHNWQPPLHPMNLMTINKGFHIHGGTLIISYNGKSH